MDVRVDVDNDRVVLGKMTLQGQWVDFYALLALACPEAPESGQFVSAESLSRVGPWRHKAIRSVGKEVARHIDRLARNEIRDVIECQGRTQSWRLAISSITLHLEPDRATVREWLKTRSSTNVDDDGWTADLRVLVEATVALQQGNAEATIQRLDETSLQLAGTYPGFDAWSTLLRGRALAQHDDEEDESLHDLHVEWSGRPDATGKAVASRLRALVALRYRFNDPSATTASLVKLAAELEQRGDIGSLAAVLNVMGLLARRAKDPRAGATHHLRAAALFGISGDYPSLQAALFNLAICRKEALEEAGQPPDDGVLTIVELCRLICKSFGVGNDSAQAEIAGAEWAHQMGDHERASLYLEAAEALVDKLDSTFDQALFLQVRGQIGLSRPDGAGNAIRDLRAALSLFTKIGDDPSVARIRQILSTLDL